MHLDDHAKAAETVTDSMRMFQWGLEGGRPQQARSGLRRSGSTKATASCCGPLRAADDSCTTREDGGEEAELAGIYMIGEDGTPYRIGMAAGNEFSDHQFEKRNYLNLAGSKLRTCSLGPELVVGAGFQAVAGEVRIERGGRDDLVEEGGDWRREYVS